MLGWQWPYWDGTKDLLFSAEEELPLLSSGPPQTGLESLLASDGLSATTVIEKVRDLPG